jgi:hypothetical protein
VPNNVREGSLGAMMPSIVNGTCGYRGGASQHLDPLSLNGVYEVNRSGSGCYNTLSAHRDDEAAERQLATCCDEHVTCIRIQSHAGGIFC